MRAVTLLIVISIFFGCSSSKKPHGKAENFDGTWIPVKQEMGGMSFPASIFKTQKLTLSGNNYTLVAESTDKGIISVNHGKMDIYGKEGVNAGKHFTAIYKFENSELTVCYNLAGDIYPETFETKGKPKYFLSVFKRN